MCKKKVKNYFVEAKNFFSKVAYKKKVFIIEGVSRYS